MFSVIKTDDSSFDKVFSLIRKNMHDLQIELGLPWDEEGIKRYYRNKDSWFVNVDGVFAGMFSIESKKEYMLVHTLQIEPRFQKMMLGYRMFKWIVKEAETHKFQYIRCSVFENNEAKKIYRSLGFDTLDCSNGVLDLQLDLRCGSNALINRLRK